MTTHDQAYFEQWLGQYATDEECALPFEQQLECHILWLNGFSTPLMLDQILVSALEEAN